MEIEKIKGIIESILFACGRPVSTNELMLNLELPRQDIDKIICSMQEDYKKETRGLEIIKIESIFLFKLS